jgi:hypothetical protein
MAALASVLMLSLPACSGQKHTGQFSVKRPDAGISTEGVFYFLPRTSITVDVRVIQSNHLPGPFSAYAEKYLGLQGVIREKSTDYTLAEISIRSHAEPDPDQLFVVEMPAGQDLPSILLSLSEAGLIKSLNKAAVGSSGNYTADSKSFGSWKDEAAFNYFIESNLQERIDTIIEHVFVDTLTVERKTLRSSWVEKSSEVRAKEVADYIIRLRDKRFDLITGFAEIPYSRETIQFMYEEMVQQEQNYLELFTGITDSHIMAYRFTFVPNPRQPQIPQTLFYFSPETGISSESRRGSQAVSFEIARSYTTEALRPFTRPTADPRAQAKGFFYRIPEMCTIIIRRGGNTLAETKLPISQYGLTVQLPASVNEIEFYPETGAIRSLGKTVKPKDTP